MKLSLLLLATLTISFANAQTGIQFVEKPWAEVLQTAKAENKLIFVDAYTTWCGPCKMLSKNIFPQEAVGNAFNTQFVNAKVDMEKGEGIALAELYHVQAYPTLLFINGDGKMVHKGVGYREANELIALAATAQDPDKQLLSMEVKYAGGERNEEFLKNYMSALDESYDPDADKVAEAYLQTQNDWNSAENQEIIMQHAASEDSKMFNYLVANIEDFRTNYGLERVDGILQNVYVTPIRKKYNKDEAQLFPKVQAAFDKVNAKKSAEYFSNFKIGYYSSMQNQAEYEKAVVEYMDKFGSENYAFLNQIAWNFYEKVSDKNLLEKALGWAKKSVQLTDGYANNDTLAALYYKTGQNKKAKEAGMHAIEIAKITGEDYSETESMLSKIK
ncbi:MAG: thioredoxin domain-containing protein [Saprospiraceae bacterium]